MHPFFLYSWMSPPTPTVSLAGTKSTTISLRGRK